MSKRYIQVCIKNLEILKRGPMDGAGDDLNVLSISIQHPSEDLQAIERVYQFKASRDLPENWDDFAQSLVFKTAIRGQVLLKVELISVDKESKAEEFFKGLFTTVSSAALGVATSGFGSAYVGAITKGVVGSLLNRFDDEEDDSKDDIGVGLLELDSNAPDGLNTLHTVPLKVTDPVKKKVYVKLQNGRISKGRRGRVDEVVVEAGENGSIQLEIREI